LWPFYLARRKLHLVSGAPGTGKTTVALNWLAVMTTGGPFPDGTKAPCGDVVIWSSEDSANDTIIPRLIAAGADRSHIYIIDATRNPDDTTRPFNPATDMDRLALQLAAVLNPVALLLDPVMATIKSGKDSHNSGDVRSGLDPVVQLAEQYDLAAIGITHFAKGTQGRAPIDRVLASVAFTAVPRTVFGCVEIPDKPGTYRFTKVKSNISPTGAGFDYVMHQMIVREDNTAVPTQRIDWGDALEGTAAQLLAVEQPKDERQQRREDAKDWL